VGLTPPHSYKRNTAMADDRDLLQIYEMISKMQDSNIRQLEYIKEMISIMKEMNKDVTNIKERLNGLGI
jgi:hypothetical protein